VPKRFGQEVLEFAQALERNPNRRATGLEEVVELIGKMGVINPLKTAGSLMQLDKPTAERMAQSGVEAAKRAYDDPSGTASRLAQGAKEALLDPIGTAGELSVSDVAGGSGLLSKLAGAANLTGPALMAAMVPGSDVSRPKRSESMGFKDPNKFGTPAFHGTTHDIQKFTLERSNPENYLGQAHYFSSSPIDASENYGGQGPDLTIRINQEMENLSYLTDNELKEIVSKEAANQFDRNMKRVDKSKQEDLRQSLLREAAKENLTTHEGAVMDVQLQLKNPLYIDGSDKEQRFKLETVYDDEGNIVDEKGNLVDLHQAIVEAGYEFDGGDGDELARMFMAHSDDYFGDKMYDEGLTATDVNYILQNMEKSDLYTDDGSFAGNEFIRQVYENLGHDSVVMDASKAFKMMGNVPEGTKHYIVFDKYANQIRSRRAKFDPKKSDSRNILASTLPIGLGAGTATASYSANKEE
jgi:hypothetical protein